MPYSTPCPVSSPKDGRPHAAYASTEPTASTSVAPLNRLEPESRSDTMQAGVPTVIRTS
ncbi:hypothetical protein ACFU6I_16280 [Streptomyces sp. NPDC057486]|uniref:hypothetical protein n=1 Tax=Streptomyces sp. NPDC057486 TaxID=3346145 RepID=UPI0036BA343D